MTSPENTVHFRSEIQLRVVSQGFDQFNSPVGPERVEQLLKMPKPTPNPVMSITSIGGARVTGNFEESDPPPRRDLYLIEDFFDSLGLRLPSRTKAMKLREQNADLRSNEAHIRECNRESILRQQEALHAKIAELERWRDYAVALDADRKARNFAVSRKCAALDPRKHE